MKDLTISDSSCSWTNPVVVLFLGPLEMPNLPNENFSLKDKSNKELWNLSLFYHFHWEPILCKRSYKNLIFEVPHF